MADDLTGLATLALAVIAIGTAVLGFLASRKQFDVLSRAVEALIKIADSQERQVRALSRQVDAAAVHGVQQTTLAERQLALKQQEMNWNLLGGIAKALGWAWDRGIIGGDEDTEDDEDS